jgi:hypothetical protein
MQEFERVTQPSFLTARQRAELGRKFGELF